MVHMLFPRTPEYNSRLGVAEYQGRFDAEAVVNQHGIVDHKRSFWNNMGSGFLDAIGAIPLIGNVVNGVRSVGNFIAGDTAAGIESALKVIPGYGNIYSGISALKNGGDALLIHTPGMIEQSWKGGYENQTRAAQSMVYGNMGLGLSGLHAPSFPFMGY
ncbi:MAG: hypothetical protein IT384_28750 [Deltaproteobacteria bacterium]|nr:hypothetical protein [Deltaproteobacteria bacterium]